MRRPQTALLSVATFVAALASSAHAQVADLEATFRAAAATLQPYLVLTDRTAAEARSQSGRAQIASAVAMLRQVTAERPDHWPSFWFIGKAHQALREHPAAYDAFKQALALKPPNPNVAREFVIEAICVHATSEAVTAAREVAASNASNAGLQANLGLALLADGQLVEAQAVTKRALAIDPGDQITKSLLAEIAAVQQGRPPSKYCPP